MVVDNPAFFGITLLGGGWPLSRSESGPLWYVPFLLRHKAIAKHQLMHWVLRPGSNFISTEQSMANSCPRKCRGREERRCGSKCQHVLVICSIYLSICLSIYLSVCLSICLSVCLSNYLSVCLSIRRSVCLSIYLSVCMCPSIYLSVCLSIYLSVCLSIYLFIYLSICLSVYLTIYLSIYLFTRF